MDEQYFLSDAMIRYILDVDGVSKGTGWCKGGKLNPSIAHALGVRNAGGGQRCNASNYIAYGFPEDVSVEIVRNEYKSSKGRNNG